jgi:hypothetical protein
MCGQPGSVGVRRLCRINYKTALPELFKATGNHHHSSVGDKGNEKKITIKE